ncbi:MAG: MerR family transcriptional regulator [Desulfovibrio sp.]|jgi:DNA-binding transcriptional MerR regulator|nr:MerR family transcriptional regulator [Desulfovibrio sp.]
MSEKTYRIGEAAELLNLKTHVLRFWETEFPQLVPSRTDKGQRLYTEDDMALLRRIQQLLHEQGMTIEGARRLLEGSAVLDEDLPERVAAVPDPTFVRMIVREISVVRRLLENNRSRT